MHVILIQDVPCLGVKGEVKKVASGYARNFLLPRRKAVLATPGRLREYQSMIDQLKKQQEIEQKHYAELIQQLSGVTITLEQKTSSKGQLYGSIDEQVIAKALEQKIKQSIKPEVIKLPKTIKETGNYEIFIQFTPQIQTSINVVVKAKVEEKTKKAKKEPTKAKRKEKNTGKVK